MVRGTSSSIACMGISSTLRLARLVLGEERVEERFEVVFM
jgi:hypothetical protein